MSPQTLTISYKGSQKLYVGSYLWFNINVIQLATFTNHHHSLSVKVNNEKGYKLIIIILNNKTTRQQEYAACYRNLCKLPVWVFNHLCFKNSLIYILISKEAQTHVTAAHPFQPDPSVPPVDKSFSLPALCPVSWTTHHISVLHLLPSSLL